MLEAVNVICDKLNDDDTLFERSELGVEEIRKLMLACLECRYLMCQGSFFEQKEGAPMGLSLSVVLANAYVEHLEETVLNSTPLKPSVWRRYVDDTFILWPHGEEALQEFHARLNSFCPSIQFTLEREVNNQLPFLDTMVSKSNGQLSTSVYRKATTSNVYMKYDSNHPQAMKAGIIRCLEAGARRVCSSSSSLKEEKGRIKEIFMANGYPERFIMKATKRRNARRNIQDSTDTRKDFAAVPYVPGVSEKIAKLLRAQGVVVAHTSKRLKNHLVRVKDPVSGEKKKGAIYQIRCSCGASYIGETGRPKSDRMKEHVADMKHGRRETSATARHFEACGGDINPFEAATLAIEIRKPLEEKENP